MTHDLTKAAWIVIAFTAMSALVACTQPQVTGQATQPGQPQSAPPQYGPLPNRPPFPQSEAERTALPRFAGPPAGTCLVNGREKKCDGFALVQEAGLPLQDMWHRDEFEKIEAQLREWCTGKERFPDGRWNLISFQSSFVTMFNAWGKWDSDRERFDQWRAKYPDSLSLALTEAIYWQQYAWYARGSGYANTVSKEGWELFGERLQKAKAVLEQSRPQSSACPLWHTLMIDILLETGSNLNEMERVYRDGARLFPGYQTLYLTMGRVYEPKWGGSAESFENFARDAARRTKTIEGDGMYARLYWTQDGCCEGAIQFKKGSAPEWRMMKSGFEDLMKRYPESTWNMNKFASFACRAYDRETYLKLREQLDGVINGQLWPNSYSVEVCDYRFAKQKPQ